jgi:hypothetical protein
MGIVPIETLAELGAAETMPDPETATELECEAEADAVAAVAVFCRLSSLDESDATLAGASPYRARSMFKNGSFSRRSCAGTWNPTPA